MRRPRLLWQLYPSYFLITLLSLLAVTWYASRSLRQFYLDELAGDLEARARFIEQQALDCMNSGNTDRINSLCNELGRLTSTRITLILPSGKVIGDSHEDPATMDNHADRPEIQAALAGGVGQSMRYSNTLEQDMMYVTVPIDDDGETIGVIRTSMPTTAIQESLNEIYIKIAIGGLLILIIAAAISLTVSRRISRPLEEMKQGAEHFAEGDLNTRIVIPRSAEMGSLAEAMNVMAERLDDRIRTITRQGNELEAILSSMTEAVLAVDNEERIMRFNKAAGRLLNIDPEDVQGRTMQETIRNIELQQFIKKSLSSDYHVEGELILLQEGERVLQAHGTRLRGGKGGIRGALVVLNDITRLKRLETIRRDFVANVSHELKTPITSIKGYVETLKEGAISDPQDSKRFLDTIESHSDRLNSIIEDLLSLSRIEQDTDKDQIKLEESPIEDVVNSAISSCQAKISAKDIRIDFHCEPDISARVNPELLGQALINLIDNAIKYSDTGSSIQVEAERTEGGVVIKVIDSGCGIVGEHLHRIFERFYRVDKSRSREKGGTGLGLAIVKHIAQAHGGHVEVESTPGKGSIFSLILP